MNLEAYTDKQSFCVQSFSFFKSRSLLNGEQHLTQLIKSVIGNSFQLVPCPPGKIWEFYRHTLVCG